MKKILFVDDEPNVLDGLRRMLRGLRREWDMEFVESGPEALDRLAGTDFDVVVSDMRMPGMDGSQLLREVMQRHPATVRMILSGQCDREAVLKCVGPTHQFLTKPCDSKLLTATVARACRLRDHLSTEWIKQAISSVESLPAWPTTHSELLDELQSPTPSIQRLGETISSDPGMTAKIMQLVNSGFFGSPQRVTDPAYAARLLGVDVLNALVESTNTFFAWGQEALQDPFWEALHNHGLSVAKAARRIAQSETNDGTLIGDAYLSGLLHDIGILVFAEDSPEYYLETAALARLDGTTLRMAEKRAFETGRDDVGAYLMGLWGVPDPVVRTIAYHLSPSRAPNQAFGSLTAVHVANALVEQDSADTPGLPSRIDTDYLKTIGSADRLDAWREICRAAIAEGVVQ